MNEHDIQELLTELYAIDPSLRSHEAELRAAIIKFIDARPHITMDETFKGQLRAELLQRAGEWKPLPPKEDIRGFRWTELLSLRTLPFVGATAAIAVVAVILVNGLPLDKNGNSPTPSGLTIERLSAGAFGSLPTEALLAGSEQGGARDAVNTSELVTSPVTDSGEGSDPGTTAPDVIEPDMMLTNYRYEYAGTLDLSASNLDVLKRVTGHTVAGSTTGLLDSFGMGMADLGSFADARIQNLTLAQDREYGYSIDINLAMGTIGISEVWDRWYGTAAATVSSDSAPVAPETMPSDSELIGLADEFLDDHDINLTAYGTPVVPDWNMETVRALEFGLEAYVPESVQVIYPLTINGKTVYTTDGQPTGLHVTINIAQQKVTGLANLAVQQYQSAAYATEQDEAKVRQIMEQGGLYGYGYSDAQATVTYALGTPEIAYVLMSRFDSNVYAEFLVPAFVFPVTDSTIPRERVIVPLIADFFDESSGVYDTPVPLLKYEPASAPAAE